MHRLETGGEGGFGGRGARAGGLGLVGQAALGLGGSCWRAWHLSLFLAGAAPVPCTLFPSLSGRSRRAGVAGVVEGRPARGVLHLRLRAVRQQQPYHRVVPVPARRDGSEGLDDARTVPKIPLLGDSGAGRRWYHALSMRDTGYSVLGSRARWPLQCTVLPRRPDRAAMAYQEASMSVVQPEPSAHCTLSPAPNPKAGGRRAHDAVQLCAVHFRLVASLVS